MRFWILGFGVLMSSSPGLTGEAGHSMPGLMLAAGVLAAFTARRRSA